MAAVPYDDNKPRLSGIALPVTVALHLLFAGLLYSVMRHPAIQDSMSSAITVLLLPQGQAERPQMKEQSVVASKTRQRRTAETIPQTTAAITPEIPDIDIDQQAAPAREIDTETLLEKARRDVGKIDRNLRKERPKLLELPPDSPQARLEKGFAGAGRPLGYKEETVQTSDGVLITKVTGPYGVRCYKTKPGTDINQFGTQSGELPKSYRCKE
ncbi:MAG TPA: hypothetical protein VEC06_09965 [Paucimonas sp.]|nr:hypothetical protein [Paucimonas sp.]